MLMQIYADITGREMLISGSSQTCALGSAVSAAVLAGSALGGYDDFETAQAKMTRLKDVSYQPNPDSQAVYNELFELYKQLHDAFETKILTEWMIELNYPETDYYVCNLSKTIKRRQDIGNITAAEYPITNAEEI